MGNGQKITDGLETAAARETKIVKLGRPVAAPEWALRQGMEIAKRHVLDFGQQAALAADIAEALYNTASPRMGGRAPF